MVRRRGDVRWVVACLCLFPIMLCSCGKDQVTTPGSDKGGVVSTWAAVYIEKALDPSGIGFGFIDGSVSSLTLYEDGTYAWFVHTPPWYDVAGTGTYELHEGAIKFTGILVDLLDVHMVEVSSRTSTHDCLMFRDESGGRWVFFTKATGPGVRYPGPCAWEGGSSHYGPISRAVYSYTGDLLMSETYDFNGDGVNERRVTYQYDDHGLLQLEFVDLGAPPDGMMELRTLYRYDALNHLCAKDTYAADSDTIVTRTIFGYDEAGHQTLIELDRGANGSIDRRTRVAYDASGRKLSSATDDDADGNIDALTTYEYDSAGHLSCIISTADQTPRSRHYLINDSAGNVVFRIHYGTHGYGTLTQYFYDCF